MAHVKGRTIEGSLPKPSYSSKVEGIIVVQVKVDQYGQVTEVPETGSSSKYQATEEAGCASLSVRERLKVLPAGNRSPGHSCICQIKCINLQKNLLCP